MAGLHPRAGPDLACAGCDPFAPGFTTARIAPRLGPLTWAKGRLPCPAGMIAVDISQTRIRIDSPVPLRLELVEGSPAVTLTPGRMTFRFDF